MTEYPIRRRDVLKTTGAGLAGLAGLSQTATAAEGEVLWQFDAGDIIESSPTVVNDTVFFGDGNNRDAKLYALDAATGDERWLIKTTRAVATSPNVVDETLYVTIGDGEQETADQTVFAIEAATGQVEWSDLQSFFALSSPTVVDDIVYVALEDVMYALDAASGDVRWGFGGFEISSSPTVVDGTVFFGDTQPITPKLYALDAETGDEEWSVGIGQIFSSPTVVDGIVFVGSDDDNVYALDAATGEEEWTYSTGEQITSSPTVSDGTVFVGSDDSNVYALDAKTGEERWRFETEDEVGSSPTVADGTVFVGSDDNNVYALDAATGDERWRFETGNVVVSSPTVVDGVLFVGSYDGHLYAIDAGVDGSSEDSRVNLGTLGHHHVFAERGPTRPGISERLELTTSFTFEPASPEVGEPVTFQASPTEGDSIEYRWDFTNDGETDATGESAEFVFEEPGETSVSLTAVGPDRSITGGETVTVTESEDEEELVYWQVDFSEGEEPPTPPSYWPNDVMAGLGNSEDGVRENPSLRRQESDGQLGDIDIVDNEFTFDDEENPTEVTVEFEVEEGADARDLHLAAFTLQGSFEKDEIDEQELFEATSGAYEGDETGELTIPIPQEADD
ncbi:MAG: PQQ-binding-like beta-propeller repeat protein [Halorubrum sp.]|uniref:outer membrane protein assembly factor BamB family protein n=1 Tax=Halorubrum sp. TaxID=1879286 RepID=UPI003970EAE7